MMFAVSSSRVSRTILSTQSSRLQNVKLIPAIRSMATIAEGVEFDTVAREWRCKWSTEREKASLVEAQRVLESVLQELKRVEGVIKVDRVVCGGCKDFKVITAMPAGHTYDSWAAKKFAPEEKFLQRLEVIEGISDIETQTYTIMPM